MEQIKNEISNLSILLMIISVVFIILTIFLTMPKDNNKEGKYYVCETVSFNSRCYTTDYLDRSAMPGCVSFNELDDNHLIDMCGSYRIIDLNK